MRYTPTIHILRPGTVLPRCLRPSSELGTRRNTTMSISIPFPSPSHRHFCRFFLAQSPRNLLLFGNSVIPRPSSSGYSSVVVFHCPRSHPLPCLPAQHSGVAPPIDDGHGFLDAFLSVAEVVCLASTAVAAGVVLGLRRCGGIVGDRVLVWIVAGLIGGALSGALVRRSRPRQGGREGDGVGLRERVDRLEEEVRSLGIMVRVLSRHLEKLGIRFRVTRKSLKDPIAQTAALAQKNSEATRALAMQEDVLEKELHEIQKVLLAMQDQQQKQLELILAIGKTSKLWDSQRSASQETIENEPVSVDEAGLRQIEINQNQYEPSFMTGGAD
ncbi:hypothetical protein MLD38_028784 [Melastoma candidum]|uniref:Uncharacterized protein n=1 Tax=Melastoma candidum TaxID=119954 RepID=A0ACB9N4F6_9MYRT|nr:hypothetical protein MLD38_028784 [Melastoma candidum]